MKQSPACFDLIREFEGLKLRAYRCPAGVWTIGFGTTGPDNKAGLVWTLEQAKARLETDVTKFATGVAAIAGDATQGQFDALVSFAYNCGLGALRSSTLLKRHLTGDHAGAVKEFAKWNKANKKVLAGLTRRRASEAALYLS